MNILGYDLILVRGLPGSGKSTLAATFGPYVHLETDNFFTLKRGCYDFDASKLKEAHEWCQQQTRTYLEKGFLVVVANTFTQVWEMDAYLDMAKELGKSVKVISCQGQYKNIHGVPQSSLDRMKSRWEAFPGEELINN